MTRCSKTRGSSVFLISIGLAERLLLGEFIDAPIHRPDRHAAHLAVMVLALSGMLHPDKTRLPQRASRVYNDVARRRLAAWFWSATFAEKERPSQEWVAAQAEALLAWVRTPSSSSIDARPPLVTSLKVPAADWLDTISYRKRSDWRYKAVFAWLARRDPRDPLTGQRISIERVTGGQGIQHDHVFAQKWRAWPDAVSTDERNNVVNIMPITQHTNGSKLNTAPSEYVSRLLTLGMSEQRLREIYVDHLIEAPPR